MIIIFLYLLIGLLTLSGISGYILSRISLNPKRWDYKKSYDCEIENERFDEKWFKGLKQEEVFIKSEDNLKLHGLWFPFADSKKTMIISHGYSYTLFGSIKYMRMFIDKGFNILLTDHRYHGLSEGKICTMGYKEKFDHIKWLDWIEERMGEATLIGAHGESMGATTILLLAAVDKRIRFLIADCPFQDLFYQFKYRLKVDVKVPAFPLLYLGNLFTKLRTGMFYSAVSPINDINKIDVPTLFIHGADDLFILPSNSVNLHKAKKRNSFIYFAPGAKHAGSYISNPDKYKETVYNFLDNIEL